MGRVVQVSEDYLDFITEQVKLFRETAEKQGETLKQMEAKVLLLNQLVAKLCATLDKSKKKRVAKVEEDGIDLFHPMANQENPFVKRKLL